MNKLLLRLQIFKQNYCILRHSQVRALVRDLKYFYHEERNLTKRFYYPSARIIICWILKHPSYMSLSRERLANRLLAMFIRRYPGLSRKIYSYQTANWLLKHDLRILLIAGRATK